jgi:hypothetical protein
LLRNSLHVGAMTSSIVCLTSNCSFCGGALLTGARPDARDISARDPHLCGGEDIRFGMRYTDVAAKEEDGTPVLDLTRAGALQPDIGDRQEQGWTERGEERE